MKKIRTVVLITAILFGFSLKSQVNKSQIAMSWQIGLGLGELPVGGSFKPSVSVGYHFSDKIYAGIIYQFRDEINRNSSSINARSTGMEGLVSSSEIVAQRFLVQIRYTPFKYGPYLSGGFVFNGTDTETMIFDERTRELGGEEFHSSLRINQTRPAGWGIALGLGYQYNFNNGLSVGFEWTPAWGQYPTPSYLISSSSTLSENAKTEMTGKMNDGFKRSVTNMYKVFHIGISFRF